MTDVYQKRYIAHQEKKKQQLQNSFGEEKKSIANAIKQRRSQRMFNSEPLTSKDEQEILQAAVFAPSSCNRHGIKLKVLRDRADKALASGILVGGTGWAHRAHMLVLFFADPVAYKSQNEKDFMHYCDVGFTAMNMWLTAEERQIGACYINPNIVPKHKPILDTFGKGIFCGALAVGNYDKRVTEADHPTLDELVI